MAMSKSAPELAERSSNNPNKSHHLKHNRPTVFPLSFYSPKLSFYILSACATLFIVLHIQSLQTDNDPTPSSWSLMHQWQRVMNTPTVITTNTTTTIEMTEKLSHAVTFLPLKDLRYAGPVALRGHTWFMSSTYDHSDEVGEVQYQSFPSPSSHDRLLCLKGRDNHDPKRPRQPRRIVELLRRGGSTYWATWAVAQIRLCSYALAYPEALPRNATLMKGLTFVSYNHYNYDNIWHGLSAIVPFVAWHKKNSCAVPDRWILYHWGEMRSGMGVWLRSLMEATFGGPPHVEVFDQVEEGTSVCFKKAVVMRHNEGGMSRDKRIEVYDLMRCKARLYCNVIHDPHVANFTKRNIGVTLFMRTGPRSFKNESAVIGIFEKECAKVEGCSLTVAYSSNLTFCDQVRIMSQTDVLVSPHGAQLTNMFLMDKNSSVMEFFPKGWLKLAGVGQYVFQWIANWSGMRHKGAWRDPHGEPCQYGEDDRRCMTMYKNGRIGHNETYFAEWTRNVMDEVKASNKLEFGTQRVGCSCG